MEEEEETDEGGEDEEHDAGKSSVTESVPDTQRSRAAAARRPIAASPRRGTWKLTEGGLRGLVETFEAVATTPRARRFRNIRAT